MSAAAITGWCVRPRLRLLLPLVCLLTLQQAGPAAAQTAVTTGASTSDPPDEMTDTAPALSTESRAAGLTTGEREQQCTGSTVLWSSENGDEWSADQGDEARTRRDSERPVEQRARRSSEWTGISSAQRVTDCPTTWDGVLCWPATAADSIRTLPCFHEFRGILYNTNGSGSRVCQSDGLWAPSADYSACKPLPPPTIRSSPEHLASATVEAASIIYLVGYSASLVALVAATAIFRHFTELHCARNIIHTNFFVTCLVNDALWIAVMIIELTMAGTTPTSCGLLVLLHYFHVATFFWMFVEGLYLYMMVVETFRVDRIRLYLYPLIGWGLPLILVTTWSIVRAFTTDGASPSELTAHQSAANGNVTFARGLEPPLEQSFFSPCPWLAVSDWDWIHIGPSLFVLACNVVFLARIMCVLITKLRSANSAGTQQHRKATKALLVLMPLLGITYILVLVSPSTTDVIHYIQAVLVSTQGLMVSLLYCFCNTEVRITIRKHWRRWRGKTYLNAANTNRTRREDVCRHLNLPGDTSATDLTYTTAAESDAV